MPRPGRRRPCASGRYVPDGLTRPNISEVGDAVRASFRLDRFEPGDAAQAAFMSGVQDSNLTAGTLGAAVRSAVAQFPDLPLTCTTDLADELDLQAPVAEAVAGAVTTLLHNIRRHAGAANCVVHADADPDTGWWEVLVRDDGNGFTPQTTPRGYGLAQQVEAAMGRIGVQVSLRSAMGEGTLVTLTHPSLELPTEHSPETPAKPGDRIGKNAFIMNA